MIPTRFLINVTYQKGSAAPQAKLEASVIRNEGLLIFEWSNSAVYEPLHFLNAISASSVQTINLLSFFLAA